MAHITFIHGMANKPDPEELLLSWQMALSNGGLNLGSTGITSSMIYWADVLYADPERVNSESFQGMDFQSIPEIDLKTSSDTTSRDQEFYENLSRNFGYDFEELQSAQAQDAPKSAEEFFPRFLVKPFLKQFLKDVHHYLFNETFSPRPGETYQVQDEIRKRFVDGVTQAKEKHKGPHIIVSHSMGTVIAYDCLKRVPNCPVVDGFITIGSPLGMTEIQNELKPEYTSENGFPSIKVKGDWDNFYDPLDIVSRADTNISNDYMHHGKKIIADISVRNEGNWRHDIAQYLQRKDLVDDLRRLLNLSS